MTSLNFSAAAQARPPETMILAAVSSGRSLLAISLPTKLALAAVGHRGATVSTAALPPVAAAASKPVVRTVMTLTASRFARWQWRCRRRSGARRCRR
jgi:hypothetical protein